MNLWSVTTNEAFGLCNIKPSLKKIDKKVGDKQKKREIFLRIY